MSGASGHSNQQQLKFKIRPAVLHDVSSIHELSWQLGYTPSLQQVKNNLEITLRHPDFEVVVIEHNQCVVGWMNLHRRVRIEDVAFLQIVALVTDEKVRGMGFGKKLLQYAQLRAQDQQLAFLGLYSSKRRHEAHGFYESAGFKKIKESYFFQKDIL